MISRSALAARSCRSCRQSILRAVAGRSPAIPSQRTPIAYKYRPIRSYATDIADLGRPKEEQSSEQSDDHDVESNLLEEEAVTPWYLEVDPPTIPISQHQVTLPMVPEEAPPVLEPMLKYIFEDMGLDNISLLDLRELDPPAGLGPNLIMLFGTARSERHLHISAGRFVRWLRRNKVESPQADGLIGPGELRTKLRRLRKKAKLMGTNTAIVPGGDNGISTGWVCVNFSSSTTPSRESARTDEEGRFSGFGTTPSGTTVVVQCMTEGRRTELDLETLWQGILRRSMERSRKIRGQETLPRADIDAIVASRLQLSRSKADTQWSAMKRASEQHRYFSTSMRRLKDPQSDGTEQPAEGSRFRRFDFDEWRPDDPELRQALEEAEEDQDPFLEGEDSEDAEIQRALEEFEKEQESFLEGEDDFGLPQSSQPLGTRGTIADNFRDVPVFEDFEAPGTGRPSRDKTVMSWPGSSKPAASTELEAAPDRYWRDQVPDLHQLRKQIKLVQLSAQSVDEEMFDRLISGVLLAPSTGGFTIKDRIDLVDALLQTISERGISILVPERCVDLIVLLVASPAYGPELEAIQKNIEYLLRELYTAPTPTQTMLLLAAYASRQDWDRFWNAFRNPARFRVPRTVEQYEFAYRSMALTGNTKLCTDALRTLFPLMVKEQPKVIPTGPLYESLRACILIADPSAEELLNNPQRPKQLIQQRQMQMREFPKMLRQVNELRRTGLPGGATGGGDSLLP